MIAPTRRKELKTKSRITLICLPLQGPKIGSLDYINDNGAQYIVVGSETTGTIFLYSVNTTSGTPKPQFETAYRTGDTDYVWSELYDMGTAGDAGLSAVG